MTHDTKNDTLLEGIQVLEKGCNGFQQNVTRETLIEALFCVSDALVKCTDDGKKIRELLAVYGRLENVYSAPVVRKIIAQTVAVGAKAIQNSKTTQETKKGDSRNAKAY